MKNKKTPAPRRAGTATATKHTDRKAWERMKEAMNAPGVLARLAQALEIAVPSDRG